MFRVLKTGLALRIAIFAFNETAIAARVFKTGKCYVCDDDNRFVCG